MKLRELDAIFLRHERRFGGLPTDSPRGYNDILHHVDTLAEAHGISFICPKSFAANGGKAGAHRSALIWFSGSPVPLDMGLNKECQPVRWQVASGDSLDNLTLTPSILEQDTLCQWYGFLTNGEAN